MQLKLASVWSIRDENQNFRIWANGSLLEKGGLSLKAKSLRFTGHHLWPRAVGSDISEINWLRWQVAELASSVGWLGSALQIGWRSLTSVQSLVQTLCSFKLKLGTSWGGWGIWSGSPQGTFLWFCKHVQQGAHSRVQTQNSIRYFVSHPLRGALLSLQCDLTPDEQVKPVSPLHSFHWNIQLSNDHLNPYQLVYNEDRYFKYLIHILMPGYKKLKCQYAYQPPLFIGIRCTQCVTVIPQDGVRAFRLRYCMRQKDKPPVKDQWAGCLNVLMWHCVRVWCQIHNSIAGWMSHSPPPPPPPC